MQARDIESGLRASRLHFRDLGYPSLTSIHHALRDVSLARRPGVGATAPTEFLRRGQASVRKRLRAPMSTTSAAQIP
jgi:hypothetical protein